MTQSTDEEAVALVERSIRALGVDPQQTRLAAEGGVSRYSLKRGSAGIIVSVHPPTAGREEGRLRIVAPVVRAPESDRQAALFRRLLEANAEELEGVAFGLLDDEVVLVAERSVRDLDASEVDRMIRAVGNGADRFDDLLAEEFGAPRSSEPRPA